MLESRSTAHPPTNEKTNENQCYWTENDTCSNNKTVLFATPTYQFDYFQWSRKQPLKMNEILKGNETAKEHQSYPITSGHNLCYAALTSEEETAMIHEITTQLAAKLASDGANSRASMASNPPCHSLAQTLNPGNPSHVSSFYANKYHTASAAIASPSHHQSDISRNSDGLNLAERYAK